jgi:hypothetical protein
MATKKTISGLTPGTWGFRFKAISDTGLSGDWSPVFTYTVIGDTTPPPVPSKPNVTSVVGGVSVKWVETGYQTPIDFNRVDVYVSSGGAYTKFGSIASINSVVTYVPPEGVTGPFTFKFTGVDRSGNVSALSEASDSVSSGTIGIDTTPPSVPSGLSLLAYNDSSDTSGSTGYVDLSWTGSTSTDLLGHYVRYGRTSSVWDEYLFIQSGQNTKRIFGLKSGTTYYFQVNATDGSNPSLYIPSTPISVLIPGDTSAPSAPLNLIALSGLDNIIAYWDRNSESDVDFARGQYEVQVSTSSLFTSIVQDCVISGTIATFNGLTTGTLYYVRVRAIDSSGNAGAWSTTASTTPSTINAETSITSGTIVGNLIAANTIVGDKIQANTVDADRFKTNTGIAGIIYVGSDDSPTGTNRIVIDGSSLLPKIYYGSGVYNNSNTSFYIDAAGKFSLKDQLSWDGSALTVRGSLNVTQASTMTANLNINSGGSLIVNGGAIRVTGTAGRVEMSSLGLVGYNASTGGSPLVTIQANTGQIVATGGQIGGFTLGPTSLTTTNSSGQAVGLYSSGQFSLGSNFNVSAAGDLTATGTFTIAGTGQTAIAANQVNSNVTSISGGVISTGTINLNNVLVNSGSGTTNTVKLSSSGIEVWNTSGTRTIFLTPSGTAEFAGTINASGGYLGSTSSGWNITSSSINNNATSYAGTTSIFATPSFGYSITVPGVINADNGYQANLGIRLFTGGSTTANSFWKSQGNMSPNNGSAGSTGLYSVGSSSWKWSQIWADTGTIQTSDERLKKNISNSNLGLNFINLLNPISYKWKIGGGIPIYDEDSGFVIGSEPIPGERTHYGFLAQEIKQALDQVSPGQDFGGWVLADKNDPDSTQSLRYEEFISPIVKAIQEISARLDALES